MAITTMDGIVAAMGTSQRLMVNKANVVSVSGRTISLWSGVGNPAVGLTTAGQATSGAVLTSADTGTIPFTNPSGGQNSYLGGIRGSSTAAGTLLLYDILWVWTSGGSGWSVTTTGAQSTVSPTALTRPDANGVGTELWVECLAVGGSSSGTSTITYTNSAGTGSRTATLTNAIVSTPPIGTMQAYTLAAGDLGVKSVQSINNSNTWTSGTFRIMIIRRIAEIPIITTNTAFAYDALDLGMPRIYDSAALGLAVTAFSTAAGPTVASIQLLQG
jgi:hypothetical protein